MTHDDLETLVAQHPREEFLVVPRAWLVDALAAQARLRKALVGLVGSGVPDELRAMADVMRNLPASDEDKAASLEAIDAIIATGTPAAQNEAQR